MLSNIQAWEGAIALADSHDDGCIGTHRFLTYVPIGECADANYLRYFFLSEPGLNLIRSASPGSITRNRTLGIQAFEALEVPLPPIRVQRDLAARLDLFRARAGEILSHQSWTEQRADALTPMLVRRDELSERQKRARGWRYVPLGELMVLNTLDELVDPASDYGIAGVYSFGRGLIDRGSISGAETKYRSLTPLHLHDVVISKLGAWEGAVAVVNERFADTYVSQEFPTFTLDQESLHPRYFAGLARSPWLWDAIGEATRGSMARRKRVKPEQFLSIEVWLPPRDEQVRIARLLDKVLLVEHALTHSSGLVGALESAAIEAFASAE